MADAKRKAEPQSKGDVAAKYTERDILGESNDIKPEKKERAMGDEAPKGGLSASGGNTSVAADASGESDLYDTVIEPSADHSGAFENSHSSSHFRSSSSSASSYSQNSSTAAISNNSSRRRYCCYIGNMTWWTTDADVQTAIAECGATDVVDVKFYENRNNGQSKGFVLGVFASETAVRTVTANLPHMSLYGQQLVVLPYTKASLAKFEDATKRVEQKPENRDRDSIRKEDPKMPFIGTIRIGPSAERLQPMQMSMPPPTAPAVTSQYQVPPPVAGHCLGIRSVVVSQQQQQPPPPPPPPPQLNAGSSMQQQPGSFGLVQPGSLGLVQPGSVGPVPVNRLPPVNVHTTPPPAIPQISLGGGVPQMSRPPPTFTHPPQAVTVLSNVGMMPRVAVVPPAAYQLPAMPVGAHINPQPQGYAAPSLAAAALSRVPGLTEAEFEEVMTRNRTVSSSAITRAVSDAAASDFASAVETLVTAISLIRQSRVAGDERCKVLISSLQDTLKGIESKASEQRSSRKRSHSPQVERSRKRHRRSSHSRSRSRDRYNYSPRTSSSARRGY